MSHDQINLNAYYDGELPPAESKAIAAHIETCPACQLELVKLAELSQHIRVFDQPMPHISQIEMARLKGAVLKQPGLQLNSLMPTARWLMRFAAALLIAGGAAVFVTTQNVSNAAAAKPATWEEAAVQPTSVLNEDSTSQSNLAEWVVTDLSHGSDNGGNNNSGGQR
jgi:anti-sigma factor RsiW